MELGHMLLLAVGLVVCACIAVYIWTKHYI